jgi:spore maturation protein CgeB
MVGSDHVWSLERVYLKHLLLQGVTAELYPAQNIFYAYNSGLANKLKLRAGISGIYRHINSQLRQRVGVFKPDVVWVFKGMEVMPETLEWMKEKGIYIVNYNPDNPFIFSGRGSGNKYVTDSIALFDLHFTYNLEVKKRLEEQYGLRTAFLPFGFELEDAVFGIASREPEMLRACFLGNPDAHRASAIIKLLDAGIPIDLYGNNWSRFVPRHPNGRQFPAVYAEEFWKTLRKYRVQLNLMRVHNEDSHNMRSFEVPGSGGIMLAPATTEHRLFFRNGEEAFLFGREEECIRMAKEILSLDSGAAGKIREDARKRSLGSGYTYAARTHTVLRELSHLYPQTGSK